MKFSLSALFKHDASGGLRALMTDANMAVAGLVAVAAVFFALIAMDAYLFYTVRMNEYALLSLPDVSPIFSAQEIDAVVTLMDAHAEQYRALTGGQ